MSLFHAKFITNAMILIFWSVNITYLDENVPRRASYGVYISQLIRLARVSSHVTDFNTRNRLLTGFLFPLGSGKGCGL